MSRFFFIPLTVLTETSANFSFSFPVNLSCLFRQRKLNIFGHVVGSRQYTKAHVHFVLSFVVISLAHLYSWRRCSFVLKTIQNQINCLQLRVQKVSVEKFKRHSKVIKLKKHSRLYNEIIVRTAYSSYFILKNKRKRQEIKEKYTQ